MSCVGLGVQAPLPGADREVNREGQTLSKESAVTSQPYNTTTTTEGHNRSFDKHFRLGVEEATPSGVGDGLGGLSLKEPF